MNVNNMEKTRYYSDTSGRRDNFLTQLLFWYFTFSPNDRYAKKLGRHYFSIGSWTWLRKFH